MNISWRVKAIAITLIIASLSVIVISDFETNVVIEDINTNSPYINIPVTCTPSQPIKAWEFSITFDPAILQATSVEEGDIFDGYTTFYNPGDINNTAGTITSIYNLIVGPGMIEEPGSLIVVNFTTISEGTTFITIENLGITNTTEYVPVSVDNGTILVDVTSPVITNISILHAEPQDTTIGWTNISAEIVDNFSVETITIHLQNPDSTWSNTTFYGSLNNTLSHGHYSFFIKAIDSAGNIETSEVTYLLISPNWDINSDRITSLFDFVLVSSSYTQTGASGWIREDVDNSGQIDVIDFIIVSIHYNETW